MKSIRRTGFGGNLFDEWRYLDKGEPGQDCAARPTNPAFVLNQPRYQGSSILLARANFGRSEEHTSELQSLMRISYAVFCLKKKKETNTTHRLHMSNNTHTHASALTETPSHNQYTQ